MEHSKRNKKEHRKGSASPRGEGPAKRSSGRGENAKKTSEAGRGKSPAGKGKSATGRSEAGKGKSAAGRSAAGRSAAGKGKSTDGAKKSGQIRLNKYIAHAGICSRREADKLIAAGLISVNGSIITEVGTKIDPAADVRYNGERLGNERKVYLLLNKPKDFVTTVDDPHAKKTVMELVDRACKERIYPVGRLDRNTTGVLLFTNDG